MNQNLWALMNSDDGRAPAAEVDPRLSLGFTPQQIEAYKKAAQLGQAGAAPGTYGGAGMEDFSKWSQQQVTPQTRGIADALKSIDYAKALEQAHLTSITDQRAGVKRQEGIIDKIASLPQEWDLKPLAGMIETLSPQAHARGFAKNFDSPPSELEKGALLAKLENQLQTQRGGVTAKDIAMIKLSQLPPEILKTDGGSKLTVTPPKAMPRPPATDPTLKDTQGYIKDTKDAQDFLDQIDKVKALLPNVKDFREQDWKGKAGMAAMGAVNSVAGTDYALTEEQQRLQQLQKGFALLKERQVAGSRLGNAFYNRLAPIFGGTNLSSKQQIAQALNDARDQVQNEVNNAVIAHPKGSAIAIGKGAVGPGSFAGSTTQPTPFVTPSPTAPKTKFNYKTPEEISAMSMAEQQKYLTDLNAYKAGLTGGTAK